MNSLNFIWFVTGSQLNCLIGVRMVYKMAMRNDSGFNYELVKGNKWQAIFQAL